MSAELRHPWSTSPLIGVSVLRFLMLPNSMVLIGNRTELKPS
jgi:hypothetical protein